MKREDNQQMKDRLLNAVISCKAETEGTGISLNQIAHRTGISGRTPKRCFPDEETMICTASVFYLRRIYDRFTGQYRETGTFGINSLERLQSDNRLSIIDSALSGKSTRTARANTSFPNMRILVAEDNDTNSKVLDKQLECYSIHAVRARNGREAVDMVNAADPVPELIFMDIQMPVMNGYDAAKEIPCSGGQKQGVCSGLRNDRGHLRG